MTMKLQQHDVTDHESLAGAVRDAMRRHAGDSWADLDVESMALLAQGRGDDLLPEKRALLLKRIASDPDLGQLLKELRTDIGGSRNTPAIFIPRTAVRIAWAACFIAFITVGIIRLGDSPATSSVEVLDSGTSQVVYLDQIHQDSGSAASTLIGDPVFVSLFIGVVLLGAGAFWPRRSSHS